MKWLLDISKHSPWGSRFTVTYNSTEHKTQWGKRFTRNWRSKENKGQKLSFWSVIVKIYHWELKNHDDDFVDDDRKWLVNFVVVVSSTTPNKVESRRPATHKLRQV